MRTCPACGEENPERARFCLACAAPLAEPVAAAEERKVVSVLFVDLVGFTARSDRADPEDVRATLQPYHARLKREIERHGGRVEKFVGDAVMAVFGAPVAHEDDAERSVRAGLAALVAIEELNAEAGLELAVRAAIDTGEALVSLGARPEAGEAFVAGDVVNIAARLQQTAPPGALVVGETTYRTTRDLIDFEPLEPVAAKGKADAVPRWLARGPHSRLEVDLPRASAAFVGRSDELELLQKTFTRALGEASVQLVTLTGEPGVGKSRLLAELRGFVEARPELVFWRQGRCLPYGEGITFWALGEIVKAHAGILDSDDAAVALAKLAAAVEAVASDSEREWVEAQLRPIVGVETADPASVADRSESFAAWRSFLEAIAELHPLVLVFEDLHWADPALLDFVEHVVDWSAGVPLLVVCTARPELHELRPGWGGGKRNAAAIALEPLSDVETARLLAELLGQAVLPADLQSALLERAGGNPLYAEEFARMLADRGLLERRALLDADTVAVPETVQAVIAARIDTLAPEHKHLLHDASVVGKVFWAGAVAAMAGLDETRVRQSLQELARKEFVRPVRAASIEGQAEYVFWHLLVRDVAYAQIPRADRATRHVAAAEWTERSAGERVTDHAELLAYHYAEALELAHAAGLAPLAEELQRRAPRFFALAGDRALHLDLARALAYYDRALALLGRDGPQRPPVVREWVRATALSSALPLDEIAERMRGAIAELRAGGHVLETAEVLGMLSTNRWIAGETDTAFALLDEALALAEEQPPGRTLAQLYASRAGRLAIGGRDAEALEYAEKALSLLEDAPLDAIANRSLQVRGLARCGLGDLDGGLGDLREGLRRGREAGLGLECALAYTNLACWTWLAEGPQAGLELYRAGLDFGKRRGLTGNFDWASAETTWCLYDSGDWDELLRVRDDVLELEPKLGRAQPGTMVRTSVALVTLQRGRLDEARALVDESLPRARAARDPQVLVPALGAAALLASAAGDDTAAAGLVAELPEVAAFYPATGRACIRAGRRDLVEGLLADGIPAGRREELGYATLRALLAEADGELETAAALFEECAAGWEAYGHKLEHAGSLVGRGRCLLRLGRRAEAGAALEHAQAVFAALGATAPAVETDELLAEAFRLTS